MWNVQQGACQRSHICLKAHGTWIVTRHRCTSCSSNPYPLFPLPLFSPRAIYLREPKCQRWHPNLPTVPSLTMKVGLKKRELHHVMTLVIVHDDLVNEMWREYRENVDEYDGRLTEGWKADAEGVLVFVSLSSTGSSAHHSDHLWTRPLFSPQL